MKTGILKDQRYLDHDMGDFHVESPERLKAIYSMISKEIHFPYYDIKPRKAKPEEILAVHSSSYFEAIQDTAGKEKVFLDPDTSTCALTFDTAVLAAGGVLQTIDSIMESKIQNGFAFVRPPGHHAERSRAMGFCFFNNVAIGAEYLRKIHNLQRVLIVDWDIHHGNGTQHSFYNRNDILFFSTHLYPYYPGSGHWSEAGEGSGEGFNINIPLSQGKTDNDFIYIYDKILFPVVSEYKPEFILVSAGFDIYSKDPLGGMRVTEKGFGAMASILMKMADLACEGKIIFLLEGGYSLEGLKSGSREILFNLSGNAEENGINPLASPDLEKEILPVVKYFQKYWSELG